MNTLVFCTGTWYLSISYKVLTIILKHYFFLAATYRYVDETLHVSISDRMNVGLAALLKKTTGLITLKARQHKTKINVKQKHRCNNTEMWSVS